MPTTTIPADLQHFLDLAAAGLFFLRALAAGRVRYDLPFVRRRVAADSPRLFSGSGPSTLDPSLFSNGLLVLRSQKGIPCVKS